LPWAFMTGNCAGWVAYSFIIKDLFVFLANSPGFILSIWLNMNASKLIYHDHISKRARSSFVHYVRKSSSSTTAETIEILNDSSSLKDIIDSIEKLWEQAIQKSKAPETHEKMLVAIVSFWIVLFMLINFIPMTSHQRELTVGITVNLNLMVFYGAPLSTIWMVLKTKSSSSIHVHTMIMNTANGIFWAVYGIFLLDYFIAVPNGIGAVLGFVQIGLCFMFPRLETQEMQSTLGGKVIDTCDELIDSPTNRDSTDEEKASNVLNSH